MTLRHNLILAAIIALPGMVQAATIAKSDLDAHFAYRITGDRIAAPIQVFDNKGKTYLQLRSMEAPPAVFSEEGIALSYTIETPYIVLSDVYQGLVLRYGRNNEARIKNADFAAHKIEIAQQAVTPGKNVWFGGAKPERETGQASAPVPAKTPKQESPAIVSKPLLAPSGESSAADHDSALAAPPAAAVTGEFFVGDTDAPEDKPVKVVSESNSVEFTIQSGRLLPVQTVRLSTLVDRIGPTGEYAVSYVDTKIGEKNSMQVRSRMIELGVSPGSIRMQTSLKLNGDYIVVISGEKK